MARKYAGFNNGQHLSSGITATLTRAYATLHEDGTACASGSPRYAKRRMLCGAPKWETLDSSSNTHVALAGGVWTDGRTECLVTQRFNTVNEIRIHVGGYSESSSRMFSILHSTGGLGGNKSGRVDLFAGTSSEISDECWEPDCWMVCHGLVVALCRRVRYVSSAWSTVAVGVAYWSEASGRMVPHHSGTETSAGTDRCAMWMGSKWFTLDPHADGTLLEAYIPFVDYRSNTNGGQGGQLSMFKATRSANNQAWTLGTVQLLYETTYSNLYSFDNAAWTDATKSVTQTDKFRRATVGQRLILTAGSGVTLGAYTIATVPTNGNSVTLTTDINGGSGDIASGIAGYAPVQEHFHSACVWRYGASGMAISVTIGDETRNNRRHLWYSNGTEFVTSTPTVASLPTTDGGTANGFTANLRASGGQSASYFENAVYTHATARLAHADFASYTHEAGGSKNLQVTFYGGSTRNLGKAITSKVDATTLQLGALPSFSTDQTDVCGFIHTLRDDQAVGECPTETVGEWLVGGDEGVNTVYKKIAPALGSDPFRFEIPAGVSGTSDLTLNVGGVYVTRNWAVFRIESGRNLYQGGPYLAYVGPGSLSTWSTDAAAGHILYSPDGDVWGLWARPNVASLVTGHFPVLAGKYVYFGSSLAGAKGLRRLPIPPALYARPMLIGAGGTNYAEETWTNVIVTPNTGNSVTLVSAANSGTRQADLDALSAGTIQPPPCNGPIYRVTGNGALRHGTFRITGTTDVPTTNATIRVKVWAYVPQAQAGRSPNAPPFPAAVAEQIIVGQEGAALETTRAHGFKTICGAGWVPLTMLFTTTTPSADPDSVGLDLQPEGILGQAAQQVDFLLAMDGVVSGATASGIEIPTIPLQVASANTSNADEALTIGTYACGDAWTALIALKVPVGGWDHWSTNRPTNRVLVTLYESGSDYIKISADPTNSRLVITDGTNTLNLAAPSGDAMVFQHESEILVGMSKTGTTLTVAASVGGCPVNTGTTTVRDVRPVSVKAGDDSGANVCPFAIFGLMVDDASNYTAARMQWMLENPVMWVATNATQLALLDLVAAGGSYE